MDLNKIDVDSIRIPLQLRFERDDMYMNLIAPARADRSLTTLILQLLTAYYQDETVRDIITKRSMGITDIDILTKQVNRVAQVHNNERILTNILQEDVHNRANDYGIDTANAQANTEITGMLSQILTQMNAMNNRMDALEQTQQLEIKDTSKNGTHKVRKTVQKDADTTETLFEIEDDDALSTEEAPEDVEIAFGVDKADQSNSANADIDFGVDKTQQRNGANANIKGLNKLMSSMSKL